MSIACICYRICIQNGYIISYKNKIIIIMYFENPSINLLCKDDEIHVILKCPQ